MNKYIKIFLYELLKLWYTVALTFITVVLCAGFTEILAGDMPIGWTLIEILNIGGYVLVWRSIKKRLCGGKV